MLTGCTGARPGASASPEGYGLSAETAIRVGVAGQGGGGGAARERAYLDRLRGPSGAPVSYERQGNCCPFESAEGFGGVGLLDRYHVWGAGLDGRITLFLNMYDPPADGEADRAPPGLSLAPA